MRKLVGIRKDHLLRLAVAALLISTVLLLVGCSVDVAQNTFDAKGDVADKQRDVFNLALWPAIAILILVEGGLIFALIRFRHKEGQPLPAQVHGNTKLELAWTILPAILILALGGLMLPVIFEVARDAKPGALQVDVIGHQWFWEFQYPEFIDVEGQPLTIGDEADELPESGDNLADLRLTELHIPIDREVAVTLTSADVIHSFWVPKLAGKLDVVPGRENRMWFNATEPGTYSAQCAEFCGIGHADMRFRVVAHESEEDFQLWVQEELAAQNAAKSGSGEEDLALQGE